MFICRFCNKECKNSNSLKQHEKRCLSNANRIVAKKWTQEKKEMWSKKCLETKCNTSEWDDERKTKHSIMMKKRNSVMWTKDKRLEHSEKMKNAVKTNPDSYSKNNVSGRVKMYEIQSTYGITKVKGKWELAVAEWLNKNGIKWTNDVAPYSYFWNSRWHLYFPDFLLVNENTLIEVKGYERERDRCKWDAVDKRLIVVKEKEMEDLDTFLRGIVLSN